MTYIVITNKDGDKDYLQDEQIAVYPECYGDKCPYYNYNGTCERINDE